MTLPAKSYPRVGKLDHDPSGGTRKRTLKFKLKHGDAILSATLTPVDALDAALVELTSPLVIGPLEIFLISADPKGDVWGVSFSPTNGNRGTNYLLRSRLFFASQPSVAQPDKTFLLACSET